jgi:uncharacterized protein (TIGR02145 family)
MRLNIKALLIITLFCSGLTGLNGQTVKDIDGNIYPTITIGNQVWIAENLKATKYNDGTAIRLVTDEKTWKGLKTAAYCWLNNDIANRDIYGALYNWYAVNTKKICPRGWHVPTDEEWLTMTTFLGDPSTAGDKLKEEGTTHWKNSLNIGTNDFGFTALPGGMRLEAGSFPLFSNSYAVWWTATQYDATHARNRGLYFTASSVYRSYDTLRNGFSVRCIKD